MADDFEAIKRKRASVKSRLTKFVTYLDDVCSADTLSMVDTHELQLRLSKMEELYVQYDEIQQNMECMCDDVESQFDERDRFESIYYKAIARARSLVTKPAPSCHSGSSVGSVLKGGNQKGKHVTSECSNDSTVRPFSIKLPTITLPKFDGTFSGWLEFRDTFKSLVHDNNNIDDVSKFHYLRASLQGSAAMLINSLELTSKNYSIAWKSLLERFDNNRLLVNNYVKALFDVKQTHESSKDLRFLVDTFSKNLRSLQVLGEATEGWDTLLIHIITTKLDPTTFKEWEQHRGNHDKVNYDLLIHFLKNKADLLETLESKSKSKPNVNKVLVVSDASPSTTYKCVVCQGAHSIYNCIDFLKEPAVRRAEMATKLKLCMNCLRIGHQIKTCKHSSCRHCKERHNTLLHVDKPKENDEIKPTVALSAKVNKQTLLSTAMINVIDHQGNNHKVRALLDCGSTACFVTERLAKTLQPHNIEAATTSVTGINGCVSPILGKCTLLMQSINSNYEAHLHCFVIDQITEPLPANRMFLTHLSIPEDIQLADPEFYVSGEVDILIGADLFWNLIQSGKRSLGKNQPTLQETKLGWIVAGSLSVDKPSKIRCNFTSTINIQDQLAKFWELEEVTNVKPWTQEEHICEKTFKETTERLPDGRFVVEIPLRQEASNLGDSRSLAERRFLSLERKLHRDPKLFASYKEFLDEYESLEHMTRVEDNDKCDKYYLPHHAVVKEERATTKLRVVYDASAKTVNGLSFNDIQRIGPTIQDDLLSILLRFRQHAIVVSADIAKMYRQVLIKEEQRPLQRILWRNNQSDPIQVFQLNTVTYGTASAPFLSIRCLKQLADECKDPLLSTIIKHDFYVDDLLTGGQTLEEATQICLGVDNQLKSGCFELRKWNSNSKSMLQKLSDVTANTTHAFNDSSTSKILGLQWNSKDDILSFAVKDIPATNQNVTKRIILSTVSQIFDPLGLISPTTITIKILLQSLWLQKLTWDDIVPSDIATVWNDMMTTLQFLNHVTIPRHVLLINPQQVELHIFSDASEKAYGACAYVRSINNNDTVRVRLLCAKSRVAPLKATTIPRLELCGALVASRLSQKIQKSLRIPIERQVFWCDSSIVLSWLKTDPSRLKTFVRNRISEIQEATAISTWRYIPSQSNPADLLSRGVKADSIGDNILWWQGPEFLTQNEEHWPAHMAINSVDLPEQKVLSNVTTTLESTEDLVETILTRCSRLIKAKRVLAYVLRFVFNVKQRTTNTHLRKSGVLSCEELDSALTFITKSTQAKHFSKEITILQSTTKSDLPSKSPLKGLHPFIGPDGLLRIRGRLSQSDIDYNAKFPIILPKNDLFTKRVFEDLHIKTIHAGPQLLLATVRQKYWALGGRNLARQVVHKCVICAKLTARVNCPLMGDLPHGRVTAALPFTTVGVDYAGPIMISNRKGRGAKFVKSYICLFVCFTTKAIHLELATDMTSETFILALKRFIGRRGKPSHIHCDNGTNFVGAWNELKTIVADTFSNEGIQFHFIPPHAPSMGGLWEAGVKSTKYHLKRVLGDAHLTYEEVITILCQIESILNSRPITTLSSSPHDLSPLTPGHFLIGRPLTTLPSETIVESNRLPRYQRIEQLRQSFWKRWSVEYLSQLQTRNKNNKSTRNLENGAIVLIKEDSPPMQWRIGEVVAIHPGQDGVVRVATVRTVYGEVRRPVSKLCILPMD